MPEEDRKKWDARYADPAYVVGKAPPWLEELDEDLPRSGAALDVAAGTGRVAVWLARRGLAVTAVDISPVGLALARETAADEGVSITTAVSDLTRDPLPDGPFSVIACFHYRQRDLFARIKTLLSADGIVIAELPTIRNLERGRGPSRRWLAGTNELLNDLAGLTVLYYREAWFSDRHLCRMVARRDVETTPDNP